LVDAQQDAFLPSFGGTFGHTTNGNARDNATGQWTSTSCPERQPPSACSLDDLTGNAKLEEILQRGVWNAQYGSSSAIRITPFDGLAVDISNTSGVALSSKTDTRTTRAGSTQRCLQSRLGSADVLGTERQSILDLGSSRDARCFVQDLDLSRIQLLTSGILLGRAHDGLLGSRSSHPITERAERRRPGKRTTSSRTGTARQRGKQEIRTLLRKVADEPVEHAPVGLTDIGERTLVGGGLAEILLLRCNNSCARLFGTEELKPPPCEHLRNVNATPEILGRKSPHRRIADGSRVLPVGICVKRLPVSTSGESDTRLIKEGLSIKRLLVIVSVKRNALHIHLIARFAERNARRLDHLWHRELGARGKALTKRHHVG
jgi:hypothetical protein